jgi:ParB-like chromosome segregation protein Spo0J
MSSPFDPKDGEFAKNIRSTLGEDDELKESMQKFGWIKEFPALIDEHDVVLVGHRRMKIAQELGIQPITLKVALGTGEAADAERFKLAIASNIGHKPMTKEDRQRIAKYLYGDREWSMQRIADALNVSTMQVSRDLDGFNPTLKPARPKGGRPKGSTRPRMNESNTAEFAATLILDQKQSYSDVELETGLSNTVLRSAVAREEGRREAAVQEQVDVDSLPKTYREQYAILVRKLERDYKIQFEQRVRDECRKRTEEMILPSYIKDHEMYKDVVRSRKGIMDRSVYRKILSCLHPDRVTDPSLKKRYEDAFNSFTKMEKLLLSEKDSPTSMINLPRTYEEMMELKRKVAEERRAARTSKSKTMVHR